MTSLPKLPDTEDFKLKGTFRLSMVRTDAFSPIIGDEGKLGAVRQIKGLTDGLVMHGPIHGVIPKDVISAEIVKTTFTKSMRGYGRFNYKKQGVWYCAFERDTAVEEMRYHCERRHVDNGGRERYAILREIFADFSGTFRDARGEPRGEGILGPDPKTAYPLGQKLAHELRAEGARGIVYPSVRDPEERPCLVAFHQEIVRNAWFGIRRKMSWSKEGKFSIEEMEEPAPLTDLWREGTILP